MSDDPAACSARPSLHARAGLAELGRQVVVHGKDLHHECLELGYVHYFLFCVTGRTLPTAQARVLEQLWIATGYPDARIWCNRIAGYLGSARVDPGLSLSAAIAATDSQTYGFRAMRAAYDVQAEIPEALDARTAWLTTWLASKRVLHGYGRPVHRHDERIACAWKTLAGQKLMAGPALKRAYWLHRQLSESKGIEMNIAAVWAAIGIDFGLARREYEGFMLLMFAPGYAAVYEDQRDRPPFSFLGGYQTRTQTASPGAGDTA